MLFFYSCATVGEKYNTPFINSTETSKLDFDMSKEEVLSVLGEPLVVKSGKGETRTIIWLYEVRTITVEGDKKTLKAGVEEYEPRKTNTLFKHAAPHHMLELEFIEGKLINWGPEGSLHKKTVSEKKKKKDSKYRKY